MDLRAFVNRVNELRFVDRDDFLAAGLEAGEWPFFRDEPVGWFVRSSIGDQTKLWKWLEAHAPPGRLPGPHRTETTETRP